MRREQRAYSAQNAALTIINFRTIMLGMWETVRIGWAYLVGIILLFGPSAAFYVVVGGGETTGRPAGYISSLGGILILAGQIYFLPSIMREGTRREKILMKIAFPFGEPRKF